MGNNSVLDNIRENYQSLFSAEKKVADMILRDPLKAIQLNITELAAASDASEATVVRMCKHIGYEGYYRMRLMLSNDIGKHQAHPDMKSPVGNVDDLFGRLAHNIEELAKAIDKEKLSRCYEILKKSKTVFIAAAGNMAPVAMDLGYRLERFGIKASFSEVPEYYLNHVSMGCPEDAVIILSKSGTSKQTLQAMDVAKKIGMPVIVITGTVQSPLAKGADILLSSEIKTDIFGGNEPDNHLYEIAVTDALLYFIRHEGMADQSGDGRPDDSHNADMEFLLSEYKL